MSRLSPTATMADRPSRMYTDSWLAVSIGGRARVTAAAAPTATRPIRPPRPAMRAPREPAASDETVALVEPAPPGDWEVARSRPQVTALIRAAFLVRRIRSERGPGAPCLHTLGVRDGQRVARSRLMRRHPASATTLWVRAACAIISARTTASATTVWYVALP